MESSKLIRYVCKSKKATPIKGFERMDMEKGSRVLFARSRVSAQPTEQIMFTSSSPLVDQLKKVSTYLFRSEIGGHVKVSVRKINGKYAVYVEVSSLELGASDNIRLMLIWGIYTSDSSSFMPLYSSSDARTKQTPFIQNSVSRFVLELEFEAKQSPFYLSFLLKLTSSDAEIRNHNKANFCVPVGFGPGYPAPLAGCVLCLYDDSTSGKPALELDLDPFVNRSGDIWHASLEGAWTFLSYGYRCKGAVLQGDTDKFDAECVLLDPYAKIIINSVTCDASGLLPKYLGRLCKEPAFEWNDDVRPNLAMEKLVVYKVNVMRFTGGNSSQISSDVAGTFAGLTEKLSHFKDLGVNAVLLEPIFPFDEQKGPYFPCHFFSPSNLCGPSSGSDAAISSMKEMVKKLHANGIEVLLEVVFTHTSEAGALQGIDDASYYYNSSAMDLESQNALNCNYPIVQRMILDSLQHWVTEFHIDGFCFINASSLLRSFDGEYLSRPPLVEAIAFDPLLSKTKIIADCWDPKGLQPKETAFPHWKRWAEINTKFCRDVRNFLRGEGLLSDLATRLCGSGDIFSSGRGPAFSFNFVSRNFGLPLVDLVSFSGNALASELSWNCVPVLNMGDECGQSSGGSTSYGNRKPFDWNALSTGFEEELLKEENIVWHGSDQNPPRWEDPSCKFLSMTLKVDRPESGLSSESSHVEGDMFIAFNAAGHSESVTLPKALGGITWHRLVDTALPFPGFFSNDGEPVIQQTYEMKSHCCILLEANISSSFSSTRKHLQLHQLMDTNSALSSLTMELFITEKLLVER
ncbi:unnamed protein product [Dovyalis caffra]|uniref:Glycosyl hydrolase family 13 catalytic domain-containing protein n=1 Tax=Dovyalis caffra TaxID=77055 RepID=A0AAV1SD14_9ROSI|nr:unnamed protein product [Dovyalis caffra]